MADKNGEIFDFPSLTMAGMSGGRFFQPQFRDLLPLPKGSELFALPERLPVGCDPKSGEAFLLEANPYDERTPVQAVAAFMAPAYTAIFNAAFRKKDVHAPPLPLFAYTAVGWYRGKFWVAGFRSDSDVRQDADQFDLSEITKRTHRKLSQNKANRLLQHLGKCCLTYGCPAARNYFLERWEAPLPVSPACNARCVGCISLQPSGCCPSTQERIRFVPTSREISELAVPHLEKADRAIVSFGQGCEGEPLLQAETIEKALLRIRRQTSRGTINLNSNASLPDKVDRLAKAGLDSLRVSLNSARKPLYRAYYRPVNYGLEDVKQSIKVMKSKRRFVSLNYFVLPGVTDSRSEFTALSQLLETCKPDFIQLRNLNMDPEWYLQTLNFSKNEENMGIRNWLGRLKNRFPSLRFGYFNPPLDGRS